MLKHINQSFVANSIDDLVVLGKFGKVNGIMGWIKIFSLTDKLYDIFNYQPWLIKDEIGYRSFFFENWRCHNKNIFVKIKTVNDRNAAFFFVNRIICINVNQLPFLKDGEYYWKQLIGCKVILINGIYIGNVINLIETGSNDVLVIKCVTNFIFRVKEVLIPFIEKEVVKEVNIIDRVIKIHWDFNY